LEETLLHTVVTAAVVVVEANEPVRTWIPISFTKHSE
jgi:hypothetical protein